MAYDGIVTSAVVWELSGLLINGRIDKVVQSEPDEIALGIYAGGENYRLLIESALNEYTENAPAAVDEALAADYARYMLGRLREESGSSA